MKKTIGTEVTLATWIDPKKGNTKIPVSSCCFLSQVDPQDWLGLLVFVSDHSKNSFQGSTRIKRVIKLMVQKSGVQTS